MTERESESKEQHEEWLGHPNTSRILMLLERTQIERALNLVRVANDKAATPGYTQTLAGRVAGIGDAIALIRSGGAE